MSTIPRVTVGLPVYNGARYLRDAVDSLLAQTMSDFGPHPRGQRIQ